MNIHKHWPKKFEEDLKMFRSYTNEFMYNLDASKICRKTPKMYEIHIFLSVAQFQFAPEKTSSRFLLMLLTWQ